MGSWVPTNANSAGSRVLENANVAGSRVLKNANAVGSCVPGFSRTRTWRVPGFSRTRPQPRSRSRERNPKLTPLIPTTSKNRKFHGNTSDHPGTYRNYGKFRPYPTGKNNTPIKKQRKTVRIDRLPTRFFKIIYAWKIRPPLEKKSHKI